MKFGRKMTRTELRSSNMYIGVHQLDLAGLHTEIE